MRLLLLFVLAPACGPRPLPPPPPYEEGRLRIESAGFHAATQLVADSRRLPLLVLGGETAEVTLDLPADTSNSDLLEKVAGMGGLERGTIPLPQGGTLHWLAPAAEAERLADFEARSRRDEVIHLELLRADMGELLSMLDRDTDLTIQGDLGGHASLFQVQAPQGWLVELLATAAGSTVTRKGRTLTLTEGALPPLQVPPGQDCATAEDPVSPVALPCSRPDQLTLAGLSLGAHSMALLHGPEGQSAVLREGDRIGQPLSPNLAETVQYHRIKAIAEDRVDLANPYASIGWSLGLPHGEPPPHLCHEGEDRVFSCSPGAADDPGLVSLCGKQAEQAYQLTFRYGMPHGPHMVHPAHPQPLTQAFTASYYHRAKVDNLKVSWNADGLSATVERDYYAETVGDETPPMDAPSYTLTVRQGDTVLVQTECHTVHDDLLSLEDHFPQGEFRKP